MEFSPEDKFNAEPPEKMMPRMFAEGFTKEEIIQTLTELDWSQNEASYLVESYLAKKEGRAMPPRLPFTGKPSFALIILCSMGFVGIILSMVLACTPQTAKISPNLPVYLFITCPLKALCYLGILQMRRFAVLGYFVLILADVFTTPLTGYWEPSSIIFSFGTLLTGFAYWNRMR